MDFIQQLTVKFIRILIRKSEKDIILNQDPIPTRIINIYESDLIRLF